MRGAPYRCLLAAVAAAAVCLACGGASPPTNFYVLDLPAPDPAEERLEHTVVVMPIRAGRLVGQGRIVYRESPEHVGFYEYHRWAEDPADTVASSLVRKLLSLGTFATVAPFDGRTRADFILRGELHRLEEIDYGGPVRAAAELSLELVETETARVVWSGTASTTGDVALPEVRSVVSGMSSALEQGISRLSGELDRHMRSSG